MQIFDQDFVKSFMIANKNHIDLSCNKMRDIIPAAAKKIIEIELDKACQSFTKQKHKQEHIQKYLFATIRNTISRLNNENNIDNSFIANDWLYNKEPTTTSIYSIKEDIQYYRKILNNTINTQISILQYNCNSTTLELKTCMYLAFKNIIRKYPTDMISYLVFLNRNMGIQCKIFQEFLSIIDTQNRNHLYNNIFVGESIYDAFVDENHEIVNNTQELYFGKKGKYARPYYIGKLIDIVDHNNHSILYNVKEYSFSKIIVSKKIKSGTDVIIKHLRISPHHQMGALSHLNKIRRNIVDRVYYTLNGKKRIASR